MTGGRLCLPLPFASRGEALQGFPDHGGYTPAPVPISDRLGPAWSRRLPRAHALSRQSGSCGLAARKLSTVCLSVCLSRTSSRRAAPSWPRPPGPPGSRSSVASPAPRSCCGALRPTSATWPGTCGGRTCGPSSSSRPTWVRPRPRGAGGPPGPVCSTAPLATCRGRVDAGRVLVVRRPSRPGGGAARGGGLEGLAIGSASSLRQRHRPRRGRDRPLVAGARECRPPYPLRRAGG